MTFRFLFCNLIGSCVLVLVLIGCSAGQPIRVLDRDSTQLTASFGGPVVPSTIPTKVVPYATIGVMHGITDEVTVHANLHAIMVAFGTFGVDFGASSRLVRQDDAMPELTIGLRALVFSDFSSIANTRLYPDASLTASWEVAPRWLPYLGVHATAQFKDAKVFISPMVGLQLPLSEKFTMQAEIIWQAANVNTESGLFRGESSLNGNGSLGAFIGLGYTL